MTRMSPRTASTTSTPLRLLPRAVREPVLEERDGGMDGVVLAGRGLLSGVRPVFAGGVLTGAGLDAVPVASGVQGVEDGPADGADELGGPCRRQDPGRADDGVSGGGQQDG